MLRVDLNKISMSNRASIIVLGVLKVNSNVIGTDSNILELIIEINDGIKDVASRFEY